MKLNRIVVFLRQRYQLDERALALMRIAISLIVLTDLCIRISDAEAFYSDRGIWPSALIKNFGWNNGYWSLHAWSGSLVFQYLLFVLHFVFAGALVLGYKTKWSTFLTWLLYVSLHNRNIYILQGGDDLLRLTLFWAIFLPWGNRYSFDNFLKHTPSNTNNPANAAYLLLIASVYLFSALLKTSTDWIKHFDAVYFALSLEQIKLPPGEALYQYPALMKILTVFVYSLEWLIPFLILWPQKKNKLRLIAFIAIALLHLGIGINLYVGLFFLIGMASALALLPASFFDFIEKKIKLISVSAPKNRNPILYPNLRKLRSTFIFIIMSLCLLVNLGTLPYNPYQLRSELFYPVNVLRLNQNWSMFAPGVLRHDGWLVYHGMDSIGRQWDLRLDQAYVDYKKPLHVVDMYKNDRWRKLAENMQNNNYTFLRPLFCKYTINHWNQLHPEKKMHSLNLYFMEKINLENYRTSTPEKQLYCTCNAHEYASSASLH